MRDTLGCAYPEGLAPSDSCAPRGALSAESQPGTLWVMNRLRPKLKEHQQQEIVQLSPKPQPAVIVTGFWDHRQVFILIIQNFT